MISLPEAKALLLEKKATCVVAAEKTQIYFDRGVKPLLDALDAGFLRDALVCDKVIGKSAAMILALGGIRALHAAVISTHARAFLDAHGIPYTFDTECPYIVNRKGDGMCPMEATVLEIDDPETAVAALRQKQKELA